MVSTASSHPDASGKTLSLSQLKRLSTSARFGKGFGIRD